MQQRTIAAESTGVGPRPCLVVVLASILAVACKGGGGAGDEAGASTTATATTGTADTGEPTGSETGAPAQPPFPYEAAGAWVYEAADAVFGIAVADDAVHVLAAGETGVTIGGLTVEASSALFRLSRDGTAAWGVPLPRGINDYAGRLALADDGALVAMTVEPPLTYEGVTHDEIGGRDILVLRYDKGGALVGQRLLGSPNTDYALGVIGGDRGLFAVQVGGDVTLDDGEHPKAEGNARVLAFDGAAATQFAAWPDLDFSAAEAAPDGDLLIAGKLYESIDFGGGLLPDAGNTEFALRLTPEGAHRMSVAALHETDLGGSRDNRIAGFGGGGWMWGLRPGVGEVAIGEWTAPTDDYTLVLVGAPSVGPPTWIRTLTDGDGITLHGLVTTAAGVLAVIEHREPIVVDDALVFDPAFGADLLLLELDAAGETLRAGGIVGDGFPTILAVAASPAGDEVWIGGTLNGEKTAGDVAFAGLGALLLRIRL